MLEGGCKNRGSVEAWPGKNVEQWLYRDSPLSFFILDPIFWHVIGYLAATYLGGHLSLSGFVENSSFPRALIFSS